MSNPWFTESGGPGISAPQIAAAIAAIPADGAANVPSLRTLGTGAQQAAAGTAPAAAQAAAIAAAATDATTKANAAIAAAATDATTKANAAQSAAIATAAADALQKASNLSDLSDASAARTNLGLATAIRFTHGTEPSSPNPGDIWQEGDAAPVKIWATTYGTYGWKQLVPADV